MDPAAAPQPPCVTWLSLAHQDLSEIPYQTILGHRDHLEVLDLSANLLLDVRGNPVELGQLEQLHTLILDRNRYTAHIRFPFMPGVTALSVNQNRIQNLPVFVDEIRSKFPNIRILCMMNNEAAPSYFNGGSLSQYQDYRQYVISQLPALEILDDAVVQESERAQARRTYRIQQSGERARKMRELHR